MASVNTNYLKLPGSYLFSAIGKKVREYGEAHPEARILRLGIGDVTLPLAPAVIRAMHKATDEMADAATFRGYAPEYGYDFLREAVARHYASFDVTVSPDDVFISDGAKSDLGNFVDLFADVPVLVPDPVYPVYVDSNLMAGRTVEYIEGRSGHLVFDGNIDDSDKVGTIAWIAKPYTVFIYSIGKWVELIGRCIGWSLINRSLSLAV